MIMKNILSCEANQIIRTQTARPHPFVFLPERMRTACDRSGANGKERDSETGYDISRHERREYILIFEVNNTSGWESATRLRKGHKGIIPNKKRGEGIHLGGNVSQTWRWTETFNVKQVEQ